MVRWESLGFFRQVLVEVPWGHVDEDQSLLRHGHVAALLTYLMEIVDVRLPRDDVGFELFQVLRLSWLEDFRVQPQEVLGPPRSASINDAPVGLDGTLRLGRVHRDQGRAVCEVGQVRVQLRLENLKVLRDAELGGDLQGLRLIDGRGTLRFDGF